jgi:hypothetical protein
MRHKMSQLGRFLFDVLTDCNRMQFRLPPVDRTPFVPTEPEPENLATRGLRIMQVNHDAVADGIEDAMGRLADGIEILYGRPR